MALANYADLVDAITGWMARAPDAEDSVISRIPDFIALAEKRFYRRLRVPEIMFRAQSYINERRERLPDNLIVLETLTFMSATGDLSTEGERHSLQYVSPAQYSRRFANCEGDPFFYTIIGPELNFGPFINYDVTVPTEDMGIIELVYFGELNLLSPIAPDNVNDILTKYPDIYLYGSLIESNAYIASQQLQTWVQAYGRALEDANDRLDEAVSETAVQFRNVAIV